jgi:hypothetical protein
LDFGKLKAPLEIAPTLERFDGRGWYGYSWREQVSENV